MNNEEFRKNGYKVIDWIADYLAEIEKFPVKSQVRPKEILDSLPDEAPEESESFESIMKDLDQIIMPGVTHWQHPNFHAYFNANNSYPSILAEAIMAGMGIQGMIWETSPSAAELEEKVLEWLKKAMNLPVEWSGVIQDTASTATLAAILSAREWKTNYHVNENGFDNRKLRAYCSSQTHSSIEKGAKIAGFGKKNLVKVPVLADLSMDIRALEELVKKDKENGYTPCIIISTQGTTGTLAMDDVAAAGKIARKYECWHHVDAAYAGNAFVLPEYHKYTSAYDQVDSFVFNPHKWMFINFDCSAYYVKDSNLLLNTFEILPEYLKTSTRGKVNDYRDWGIPLGRRFRALKLWFVIRTYGLKGIRSKIKEHIDMAAWLENKLIKDGRFEIITPRSFNLVVFRYNPGNLDENSLNHVNQEILETINKSGKAYLTHTKIGDKYVIRINLGGTYLEWEHVEKIYKLLTSQIE